MKKVLTFSSNGGVMKGNANIFFKQVSNDIYNVNGKYVDIEAILHSLKAKATIK